MTSADTCGHPTADGSPCQNPATDGDTCWLDEHGGNAKPSGRPTRLTENLIQDICESVASGTLVKDVWAIHNVPRRTWEHWRRKGREDLEANDGEPTTIYGEFLWALTRAEHQAREHYHRMLRDGVITRKGPLKDEDGELILDADGAPIIVPVRIDPETGEEITGEMVQTSNLFKYLKARWSGEFAEKTKLEHSGEVEGGVTVNLHPGLAAEHDDQEDDREADSP